MQAEICQFSDVDLNGRWRAWNHIIVLALDVFVLNMCVFVARPTGCAAFFPRIGFKILTFESSWIRYCFVLGYDFMLETIAISKLAKGMSVL